MKNPHLSRCGLRRLSQHSQNQQRRPRLPQPLLPRGWEGEPPHRSRREHPRCIRVANRPSLTGCLWAGAFPHWVIHALFLHSATLLTNEVHPQMFTGKTI